MTDHAPGLVLAAWILNPPVQLRFGYPFSLRVAVELRLQPIVDEDHLGLSVAEPVFEQGPLPGDVELGGPEVFEAAPVRAALLLVVADVCVAPVLVALVVADAAAVAVADVVNADHLRVLELPVHPIESAHDPPRRFLGPVCPCRRSDHVAPMGRQLHAMFEATPVGGSDRLRSAHGSPGIDPNIGARPRIAMG